MMCRCRGWVVVMVTMLHRVDHHHSMGLRRSRAQPEEGVGSSGEKNQVLQRLLSQFRLLPDGLVRDRGRASHTKAPGRF
jgi:hypothetical protein